MEEKMSPPTHPKRGNLPTHPKRGNLPTHPKRGNLPTRSAIRTEKLNEDLNPPTHPQKFTSQELNEKKVNIEKMNSGSLVGQEQIHELLFGEKLSWQAIIYDLINTEQLDPWSIDLVLLSSKYLERVREIEEANFFVSSKVLFAAALFLRIKSEILLNEHLKSLDEILFGREERKKYEQERIELDEDIPELILRTPLPRFRKVSLHELMSALGKAINTETRRIRRVVVDKQREMETRIALPRNTINLKDKLREVYGKLKEAFKKRDERMAFKELGKMDSEEKLAVFVSLLHLDNQHKIFLEQEGHLEEIYIWMKKLYDKKNKALLEIMEKEANEKE